MKISISLRIDSRAEHKSNLIIGFSESLKSFFEDKEYGESLKEILITCICTYVPIGYEHLFKTKKPLYTEYKSIKNKFTGETLELNKILMYDIQFTSEEYEDFIQSSDSESRNILKQKVVNSLENLEIIPKKAKDFLKEKFKFDIIEYLNTVI